MPQHLFSGGNQAGWAGGLLLLGEFFGEWWGGYIDNPPQHLGPPGAPGL